MKKLTLGLMVITLMATSIGSAQAVYWTDWTDSTPSSVTGSLTIGPSILDVTFSGPYSFAQLNSGTNYWNPSTPYLSATVTNAPPAPDIIALGLGGSKTITFSQPVQDPILALVSWNGNTVDFGTPITILSYGTGYWGNGTPILNVAGTGFFGSGEVHGAILLTGTFSSISFTDTTEYWHGLTVGVNDLATPGPPGPSPVPEPSAMLLFGSGLVAFIGYGRRRFKK